MRSYRGRMTTTLPSPLVSAQWLADHLGADGLLVVDASVVSYTQPNGKAGSLSGHEQYIADGHVPGALFADLIEEFSDPDGGYPFTRPDAARFAAAAGALGIGPETTVVDLTVQCEPRRETVNKRLDESASDR